MVMLKEVDLTKRCRWAGEGGGEQSEPKQTCRSGSSTNNDVVSSYTSLSDLMPTSQRPACLSASCSFGPRTPIKNELVEKAAMAYLRPNQSFSCRRGAYYNGMNWRAQISTFLSNLLLNMKLPSPYHLIKSAVHFADLCLRRCIAIPTNH